MTAAMDYRHDKSCLCVQCRDRRDRARFRWIIGVLLLIAGILLAALFSGCASTITPAPVHPAAASFDGGTQNSGIIGALPAGFLVTDHFRDRYRALAERYGREFTPALQADEGIRAATTAEVSQFNPQLVSSPAWVIDAQHMTEFVRMNLWLKSGRIPSTK